MNYDQYIYGNVGKKQVSAVPSNDDFHTDYLHSSTLLWADNYNPTQSTAYNSEDVAPTFQKENTDFVAGNAGDYNDGKGADTGNDWGSAAQSILSSMQSGQDKTPVANASDNGALAAIMSKGAPQLGAVPDSSAVNPYLMTTTRLLGLNGGSQ